MNFYSIYKTILEKIGNNKKGIKSFNNILSKSPEYKIQKSIFESLLKKYDTEQQIIDQLIVVENYCKKLSYKELEQKNKTLFEYFNLKESKKNNIYTEIDKLIRYNSGGFINLNEGVSYRKNLVDLLFKKDTVIKEEHYKNLNKEQIKSIVENKISDEYNELTKLEKDMLNCIQTKNYNRINNKIAILEKKTNKFEKKNKELLEKSLKVLKEKVKDKTNNFENIVYETYDLMSDVLLLEGAHGTGIEKRMPNVGIFKNIIVSCSQDKDAPEQIIIDFNVGFKPQESDTDGKAFQKLFNFKTKSAIRSLLSSSFKEYYTNDFIYDSTIPTVGLKFGKEYVSMIELYLETNNQDKKDFSAFVKPSVDFLVKLEKLINTGDLEKYLK